MAYAIRPYRENDAEALAIMVAAAISEIGAHAYSPEQVAAWSARHTGAGRYRERVAMGDVIFVAADADDKPVAYALIERDGHLDHLYNHPDHTRRGLAAQLLASAESHARERGIAKLYTEASDLARPVFERAGYIVTGKREFTIAHEGRDVPIHNWPMEKLLK
ncbi:GNAT family N-acetyltransferase [Qipengyuania qiaonensis]|uniref:GNAT family N-acetyltransferase n=1 Tax=Qipengyuania qiaonensis TaxID=2867240 RepID=A0ABS7J4X3_9SPHN|nr:GNAT family N-acetyltransferase [Qipengyuania qiaonensis]MBX7481351.1 GNAT family N-acetyltransferase [Qipengyuania qiaonensis]